MALIGSITNYGSLQGEVNTYGNSLTGEITDEVTLDGEIVGLRGLKGDKGDTGDTGATGADGQDGADGRDGADGQDGFSPSASVSKVGHTATITITDKDGTTTAEVYDGSSGASAFIAEYGVTTYADVKDAYDEDATIICTVDDSGNTAICQLAYFDDADDVFYFAQPMSDGFYVASIAIDDTWDDGHFQFASTDTATQLRDGLMTSSDKTKLDGIESGAEVNVQSDWNEADSTADDYIKNKPTIPSQPSDIGAQETLVSGTNIKTINNVSLLGSGDISVGGGGSGEIPYCTCSDSASTVAKTATLVNGSFDSLTTGAQVAVKFTYTNTATNPTLNVNNTGAKGIRRGGTIYVGTNANESWGAGNVVILVYDGTDWQVANWLNTTYTGGTGAEIISGSLALNKVWSPQQIHDGILGLADKNVQSDWNEADNTADDYIKNKPTIPSNISDGTGTSVETLGDLLAGGALFANGAEFSKKTGNHLVIGGIHVCWGVAEVTPVANAYAETEVTLPYTYSSHPVAFASPQARSGQVRTVYANQSDTQAGNKLYVGIYRSNTTVTNVAWMTIGV